MRWLWLPWDSLLLKSPMIIVLALDLEPDSQSVRVFLLARCVFLDVAMLVATVDIMVKCCISLFMLLFTIIS